MIKVPQEDRMCYRVITVSFQAASEWSVVTDYRRRSCSGETASCDGSPDGKEQDLNPQLERKSSTPNRRPAYGQSEPSQFDTGRRCLRWRRRCIRWGHRCLDISPKLPGRSGMLHANMRWEDTAVRGGSAVSDPWARPLNGAIRRAE